MQQEQAPISNKKIFDFMKKDLRYVAPKDFVVRKQHKTPYPMKEMIDLTHTAKEFLVAERICV